MMLLKHEGRWRTLRCVRVGAHLQGEVVHQAAAAEGDEQHVGEDERSHGVGDFLDLSVSPGAAALPGEGSGGGRGTDTHQRAL